MLFKRFSIVPELSSAARIPLPGATSFFAIVSKSSVFIIVFVSLKEILTSFLAKSWQKCKPKPKERRVGQPLIADGWEAVTP